MRPILLDTHIAIFAAEGKLPQAMLSAIDAAEEQELLLLSPITAWEIAMLVTKRRITLDQEVTHYVRSLYRESRAILAEFSPRIAVASTMLPGEFHNDPADRILIATAAEYGADLATQDRAIQSYAKKTKHIRCLAA
jgi:PIN domain nuclease of toxin-antitoxin system